MAHAQNQISSFDETDESICNGVGSVQPSAGSRVVRISGSNAGYTMFRGRVQDHRLPKPLACSPFTSLPVSHRVPSHFNWALLLEHIFANYFAITATQVEGKEIGKALCNLIFRGPCIVIYSYINSIYFNVMNSIVLFTLGHKAAGT